MNDLRRLLEGKSARKIIDAIPAVIGMLNEQGVDFRRPASKIVETVVPLLRDEPLQDRISRLYEQLDRLDASEDAQASYLLDRLRHLEEQEAEEYARKFDAWLPLNEGAFDAALEHARSLLRAAIRRERSPSPASRRTPKKPLKK